MRRKGEGWAEFGEDLKALANKTYSDLDDTARELCPQSVPHSIEQPSNCFAVKQIKPTMVDDAVLTTLEMESYSKPVKVGLARSWRNQTKVHPWQQLCCRGPNNLKMVLEGMEHMEAQLRELQQSTPQAPGHGKMYCELQGNGEPPVL